MINEGHYNADVVALNQQHSSEGMKRTLIPYKSPLEINEINPYVSIYITSENSKEKTGYTLQKHGYRKTYYEYIYRKVATFTTLVAFFFLVLVCRHSKESLMRPSTLRRRLLDNGDSSVSSASGLCGQGDSISPSYDNIHAGKRKERHEGDTLETPRKSPRLDVLSYNKESRDISSLGFLTSWGSYSHNVMKSSLAHSEEDIQGSTMASSSVFSNQEQHAMMKVITQNNVSPVSPSHPQHVSSHTMNIRSDADLEAAKALMLLHAPTSSSQAINKEQAQHGTLQQQTSLPMAHLRSYTPQDNTTRRSQPFSTSSSSYTPLLANLFFPGSSVSLEQQPMSPQPLQSMRFTSYLLEAAALAKRDQRFVSLPAIPWHCNKERLFNKQAAIQQWYYGGGRFVKLSFGYLLVTELLTKQSLTVSQLEFLGSYASYLAASIRNKIFKTVKGQPVKKAIVPLATCFLSLNALVSALHVLEISRSEPWWGEVVKGVPQDYQLSDHQETQTIRKHPSRNSEETNFLITLSHKLRYAIGILKKGDRLQDQQIIDLHIMLFFSPYSPSPLRDKCWNVWMRNPENKP